MSGRLIGLKTRDLIVGNSEPVLDSPRTVWVVYVIIYVINYGVDVVGPEMAMDFGFTKWNRC